MVNAVFIQNPESIYADEPGVAYHFPKQYLGAVRACVGDWVVFYEGRQGAFGYTGVQKVRDVVPDPRRDDHFFALLDPGSAWSFETIVPRQDERGRAFETMLRRADGSPMSGGANTLAVRRLSPGDFAAIVRYGLRELTGPEALPRFPEGQPVAGFSEETLPFQRGALAGFRPEVLTSRKYRDPSFERQVKAAYGGRCAISGLELRNGGGRSEVQAAHIRPVANDGPDIVQNGIALSGTLHWMFDRGLIGIAEDYRILVSHNKVSQEVAQRLLDPGGKLHLPENPRLRPHPDYLRFHREEIFGQSV